MKAEKKNPLIEDIDLDFESDKVEMDDMDDIQVATPKSPIGMNIMDFSEFEAGIEDISLAADYMKALIYGPNGTGKNTIASTFPGPILVLDINEKGTRSMIGHEQGNVKKRFLDTFEMFVMAYWYLKTGNHPYKTVVIDNATTLQEIGMRFVMKKEADNDLNKDMDMPNKHDWGNLSQLMKKWVIEFRNLDMNVVFIAQEKRTNDEDLDSDEVSVFPQVIASVKAILGAAVDVIGRTYVVDSEDAEGKSIVKFCMRVLPNTTYMAKIRLPIGAKSPTSLVNPSYAALKLIMDGNYKKGGTK
jgi:phage nucleotide-binding protein